MVTSVIILSLRPVHPMRPDAQDGKCIFRDAGTCRLHHEKKNESGRTSKRQDARNRPVRPARRERAVLHFVVLRKCRWILRPIAIWQSFTFLLQSRKALRSCCNLAKLYVQDEIFIQFMSQRYYIVY